MEKRAGVDTGSAAILKRVAESAASHRVVDAVKDMISGGQLQPGRRIVESDIARRLSVSRSSVREGLRLLASDRIVVVEHNRGVTVRDHSRQEVLALHQVREVLEGLAASLAAGRVEGSDAHRAKLSAIHTQSEAVVAAGDIAAYAKLNAAFHKQIIAMSGNDFIETQVVEARTAYFRLQIGLLDQVEIGRSLREHGQILDTILRRDPDKAEMAMRLHIRSSRDLVLRSFGPLP